MAAALSSAPSASPSPLAAAAAESPSRPVMDEVLEEEIRTEADIASVQDGINLVMSIEDMFGFSVEFPSTDVPDIQGEYHSSPVPLSYLEMMYGAFMSRQLPDSDSTEFRTSIQHLEGQLSVVKQNVQDLSCQFASFQSTMLENLHTLQTKILDL